MSALWLDSIVRTSIQGSLLVGAAWLLCRVAAGRLSIQTRKLLWWLVCLKTLVGLAWINPPALRVLPANETSGHSASAPRSAPSEAALDVPPLGTGQTPSAPAISWPFLLWIGGVTLMAVRVGIATARMRGTLRRSALEEGEDAGVARRLAVLAGLKVSPRVVLSTECTSPFAAGWWRPTIVLPSGFEALDADERRMALAHEVAHLRHGDVALNAIPELARVLFFFLPPVWLACREWAAEREALCDQEALAMTGAGPKQYREMLLKVAAKDSRPMAAPALGATSEFGLLRRRIERVGKTTRFSIALGTISIAAAVPTLVPWRLMERALNGEVALVNPGFESGDNDQPVGWTRGVRLDGVRYSWDRQVGHSGNTSLSIEKTADRYFPIAEWTQSIPVPMGTKAIEISAWMKTATAYKAVLDVQFATVDGIATHRWLAYDGAKEDGDPPSTHDWTKASGVAEIPAGTVDVIVALQDYGPGQVWFDDITARFIQELPRTGETETVKE